ncbi:MAG TPA: hypothetical protein VIR98_01185 [Candidatus Paceibacterota bacterium]|jgi:hypothetical protein
MNPFTYCRILIGLAECQRVLSIQNLPDYQKQDFTDRRRNLRQLFLALAAKPAETREARNDRLFRFAESGEAAAYASTHP